MATETEGPSRQVLEETPERVLRFLTAVARSVAIRGLLAGVGYTATDHQEGWDLLHRVAGYKNPSTGHTENAAVREAIAELDAWDEPNFRRIRAALRRRHPEVEGFVFENLKPAVGPGAILSVATLLDRLDALEAGAERKATRKQDHAALATLAARGVSKELRARLRKLVVTAQGAPDGQFTAGGDEGGDARLAELGALKAWFDEWSETARATISRKDHLVALGLASRKKAEKKAAREGDKPGDKPVGGPAKPEDSPAKPEGSLAKPEGSPAKPVA